MKLVLDTNVYLAAYLTRGLSAEVLEYAATQHEIYASWEVINEFLNKLVKKFHVPKELAQSVQKSLLGAVIICDAPSKTKDRCRDKMDAHVIDLVAAVQPKYLITGDKDLLVLKTLSKTRIVTPRAFFEKEHK